MSKGKDDSGTFSRRPAASFPARLERQGSPSSSSEPVLGGSPRSTRESTLLRPQRPVREAVQDRLRAASPEGLGLDSSRVRLAMVRRLQRDGLADARVAQALAEVPRHVFVDTALAIQAYEDTSLPIGFGQTISKPSVVARMIELLCMRPAVGGTSASEAVHPLGKVMEIGTGCGYQAAVLARLAREVISIERLRPLQDKARVHLRGLGLAGVRLLWGDGMLGHAPMAPYDSIIAAACGSEIPAAWLDQLAVGGRLVAPLHPAGQSNQLLCVVDRYPDGSLVSSFHESVLFVPLKSGAS